MNIPGISDRSSPGGLAELALVLTNRVRLQRT